MTRVPALILLCLSIALAGVGGRPSAKPAPTPSPAPSATPHAAMPLVVVYPFDTSTDLKADTGLRASQLFVGQMNAAGGIDAIEGLQTVKRSDYLKYAKSVNADYYVAGYMTPLGTGVSLVEQVVATQSGTIVFGQTALINSFEDAASQAVTIHDGIVARENGIASAISQSSARATPTPLPNNEANIGGLARIFKHRGKATPHPRTAAAKPAKGVYVVRVSGKGTSRELSQATNGLFLALNAHYNARMIDAAPDNLSKEADHICGTNRNNTIATGAFVTESSRRGFLGAKTRYTFTLHVYTCFGAELAETSNTADSLASAVSGAVDAYAAAHPDNG